MAQALSRVSCFEPRRPCDDEHEIGIWPGWQVALLAQLPIDRYRVDFALSSSAAGDHRDDSPLPWIVVVECDGHEFHDRTKEQARRDKSRDRFLTAFGAKVMRFTGAEIYADADACAEEVFRVAALGCQQENFDRAFERWLRERPTG